MLTAGQIMTTNISTCHEDTAISEAIEMLLQSRYQRIASDGQVRQAGGHHLPNSLCWQLPTTVRCRPRTVGQHMTRDVISIDADEPINKVADVCIVHRVRRVPVVKKGRVVGLISRRDVLRALYEAERLTCHV